MAPAPWQHPSPAAYDKASSLRFVTDALGNVTPYQYDDRDRQSQKSSKPVQTVPAR